MTLLQIAFDSFTSTEAAALAERMGDAIDLIEAGTPLLAREGAQALRVLRHRLPAAQLVADYKIIDAGGAIASHAFAAGANWVSVLGCAEDTVLADAVAAAHAHGGHVMADLVAVSNPLARAQELIEIGITCVVLHATQPSTSQRIRILPWAMLDALAARGISFAVAGGIPQANLAEICARKPAIVMIGTAITAAPDPIAMARVFRIKLAKNA